jgi:hypothetical protein
MLAWDKKKTEEANSCEHPWGEPLGYPHQGFWRCAACGDIYTRKEGMK